MLLIVEIWLMVVAWRKGWRGWALLPLGSVLGVAIFIGGAVGASGGSVDGALPLVFLLELAAIGVLIRLAARAPRWARIAETAAVEGSRQPAINSRTV